MPTAKPAVVSLNASHAFAEHLLLMVAFTEGTGQPGIVRGADGVTAGAPTSTSWDGNAGTWTTNSQGACIHGISGTTGKLQLGADGNWLPTTECTIAIVRGRTGGLPVERFLRVSAGSTATLGLYLPYNDGIVYFDYGGVGAPNRITKASLSFASDPPDTWVLTAGTTGSAIYQNGTSVYSQGSSVSRTSDSSALVLMYAGDTQDVNFFQISAMRWDDARVAAWAADPYAHLVATAKPSNYYAQQRQQAD